MGFADTHAAPAARPRAAEPITDPFGARGSFPTGGPPVERVAVQVLRIPTDALESDGTFAWDSTTMVIVEVEAGGTRGLGYTYAASAAANLIAEVLAGSVIGGGAWEIRRQRDAMVRAVRNLGRPGVAATAISALDVALWDLKSRLLDISLLDLLGGHHDGVPAYGSGGFTSYNDEQLARQLGGWAAEGFGMVKVKVGRDPGADPHRLAVARRAIGSDVELFVDANGAFARRAALRHARRYAERDVAWFEEPVTSDDPEGLRFVRDHAPAGMAIAAGEYCWGPDDVRHLVENGAVDVLQLDATRCLGVTGFIEAASLAAAWHVPISTHCAPSLHAPLLASAPGGLHLEWFHDHVRIEHMVFDGAPQARGGVVVTEPGRRGLGLQLKARDAERWRTWEWRS